MKYLRIAALAAALMALSYPGSASATELTAPHGTKVGLGTVIHMINEGPITIHPPIGSISCSHFTIKATITNAGGPSKTETVVADINEKTFGGCNATVTVLKKGKLEIHTDNEFNDGNGTVTSTGTEITAVLAGFHCIFSTNGTDLGTLTGYTAADTPETHATLDLKGTLPRTGGSSGVFCGSTATITGALTITTPKTLTVD